MVLAAVQAFIYTADELGGLHIVRMSRLATLGLK